MESHGFFSHVHAQEIKSTICNNYKVASSIHSTDCKEDLIMFEDEYKSKYPDAKYQGVVTVDESLNSDEKTYGFYSETQNEELGSFKAKSITDDTVFITEFCFASNKDELESFQTSFTDYPDAKVVALLKDFVLYSFLIYRLPPREEMIPYFKGMDALNSEF